MRKLFLFLSLIGITTFCFSNNISVTNVTLTGQNTTSDFTLVQFDISWDNSWRTSTYESNWDAAWVFVKWRLKTSNVWHHATLHTSGYTAPTGSTITMPTDGKGAFIYRSSNGIGTNTWTGAQLRWNYGVDGAFDADLVEVSVSAIEMVYVPQGSFYVGSGIGTVGEIYVATLYPNPYQITSEGAITVGSSAGNLWYSNGGYTVYSGDMLGPIPAAFPKGYNAFYMMKYEISQEQYVAFLNKLSYLQQSSRTSTAPSSAAGTGALINPNDYRNGIDVLTPGVNSSTPAVYACEFNADVVYNNVDDGQNIACNYLTWEDQAAYLDWSGLRPFTELEYEKASRGSNLSPVANEYAWGNTNFTVSTGITNTGFTNEYATNAGANVVANNDAGVQGPMRVGSFAQVATNRQNSGGSYYGIMEFSGNLWEQPIGIGYPEGRNFADVNGNGVLDYNGDADVTSWPISAGTGYGFRGGSWFTTIAYDNSVSCRKWAAWWNDNRSASNGGRGARTAP